MASRDLEEWQHALDLADADLREREHRALQGEPTEQELRAFAAERDKLAADRDALADARDEMAGARDVEALARDVEGSRRDRVARDRWQDHDPGAVDRFLAGADRDRAAGDRGDSNDDRQHAAHARRESAEHRQRAADDRDAAATRAEVGQHELDELQDALTGRLEIGQAQGLLMARYNLDADAAFRMLTRLSHETGTQLRDVAAKLVAEAEAAAETTAE
ncbi:MAG: hypothetical protein QOC82_2824 [Frankiaceae bacterium]|nr:hypothetical protein [Frankiaceae bacterium]